MNRKLLTHTIFGMLLMIWPFVRAGAQSAELEYWFDQGFVKKSSIPINMKLESEQELSLDLSDEAAFPYGLHRLNMRVVTNDGQFSPIYSSLVMRLRDGQKDELTYWLDEDYQNGRHVIKAKKMERQDAQFVTTIDLSSAAPGMHRFKYRIATNGIEDGVVYEVPVLITKRYNSQGDVFVVGECRWVDDVADSGLLSLSNPQSLMNCNYELDPSYYSNGQHVFYVQYMNSAEVWSATNATYFYKDAATGRLVKGIMPDVVDGIADVDMPELMSCMYNNGTIIVDCQSTRLGSEGILIICDLTGRVLVQEIVKNVNGIHAEVSLPGNAQQLLAVKLVCGSVVLTKKLMGQ